MEFIQIETHEVHKEMGCTQRTADAYPAKRFWSLRESRATPVYSPTAICRPSKSPLLFVVK